MKNIPDERKLSLITEFLLAFDFAVTELHYDGTRILKLTVDLSPQGNSEDESDCPCFDPDEDDPDENGQHCIHCCPECGTCMLGLGGEDC